MSDPLPSAPAPGRPDGPTGGTLRVKRGADRDVVFHATRTSALLPPSRPAPRRRRRKCLLCGKPALFLAAPLVLVVVFMFRLQRQPDESAFSTLAGYAALLEVSRSGDEVLATVGIKPAGGLVRLALRSQTAAAGSPVEVVLSSDNPSQRPVLLYGAAPGDGDPAAILQARLAAQPGKPLAVSASLSIGGKAAVLRRAAPAVEGAR